MPNNSLHNLAIAELDLRIANLSHRIENLRAAGLDWYVEKADLESLFEQLNKLTNTCNNCED